MGNRSIVSLRLNNLPRLLRTSQRLRWSQLAHRGTRILRMRMGRWTRDRRLPIGDGPILTHGANLPAVPATDHTTESGEHLLRLLREGELRQLNETQTIGRQLPDWRLGARDEDRLWIISLHYHAWAFELAKLVAERKSVADEAANLLSDYLDDWLSRCDLTAPGAEDLAWNAYAIATRLGWWGRALRVLPLGFFAERTKLLEGLRKSAWRQARYLAANIEWDLRANHLLRDGVGLAWASRLLAGPESSQWMRLASRIAATQALEQVLPDGGHFERSPMYHLDVMGDFLALAILLEDRSVCHQMRDTWLRMAEFAAWMQFPDGTIPQFNDAGARKPGEQLDFGEYIGVSADHAIRHGGRHFADTGLIAWQGHRWTVFFDIGPVGPDCQPGHAHADTLSLDCSFAGRRLFVDPGCYGYDNDERRRYDRSTAAHNTVCVDGQDSSEVWHIFRVGRRSRPRDTAVAFRSDGLRAGSTHDGYDHLPGSPRHRRTVAVSDPENLTIADSVSGKGLHCIEGGFLLAPSWRAEPAPGGWRLTTDGTRLFVRVQCDQPLELGIHQRPWHADYGVELATSRLSWRYAGPLPVEAVVHVGGEGR